MRAEVNKSRRMKQAGWNASLLPDAVSSQPGGPTSRVCQLKSGSGHDEGVGTVFGEIIRQSLFSQVAQSPKGG